MDAPESPTGHAHAHEDAHDIDWDALSADHELEAEVVAPYIVETAAWIAARCGALTCLRLRKSIMEGSSCPAGAHEV